MSSILTFSEPGTLLILANSAPTVGTITQIRVFGGVIGLVICRVTQQSYLRRHLPRISTQDTTKIVTPSIASISHLAPEAAANVRRAYGEASNMQWRILAYIAAANLLIASFSWQRHPNPIKEDPSSAEVNPEPTELEANKR